jgi:hypothetical protein
MKIDLKYEKEFLRWYEGCGLSKGDPIDGTDYEFLLHQECWNTALKQMEKWKELAIDLYKEHIGSRAEGDWEELMKRAKNMIEQDAKEV